MGHIPLPQDRATPSALRASRAPSVESTEKIFHFKTLRALSGQRQAAISLAYRLLTWFQHRWMPM
jgi:hypothetical protein